MNSKNDWSRRTFLQTLSTAVPTLKLMTRGTTSRANSPAGLSAETTSAKFTRVDLGRYFNASSIDFGPRERARELSGDAACDGLIRTPVAEQTLRGIPFLLGADSVQGKCWVVLSTRVSSWATRSLEIPLGHRVSFVCLAQFCDWDENETPPPGTVRARSKGS